MAQIPKGRLVKGPYKPVCRTVSSTFQLLYQVPLEFERDILNDEIFRLAGLSKFTISLATKFWHIFGRRKLIHDWLYLFLDWCCYVMAMNHKMVPVLTKKRPEISVICSNKWPWVYSFRRSFSHLCPKTCIMWFFILLMEEILHQLIGSLSHYLYTLFFASQVVFFPDFRTINSIHLQIANCTPVLSGPRNSWS